MSKFWNVFSPNKPAARFFPQLETQMQQKSWFLDYCYFFFNLVAVWHWNCIQTYPERNINFTLSLSLSLSFLFLFFFYRFACFCEFWESEWRGGCQVWLLFRFQVRDVTLLANVRFLSCIQHTRSQCCRLSQWSHKNDAFPVLQNIITSFSNQYPVFDGWADLRILYKRNNKTQECHLVN